MTSELKYKVGQEVVYTIHDCIAERSCECCGNPIISRTSEIIVGTIEQININITETTQEITYIIKGHIVYEKDILSLHKSV